ncbi:MAG: hypothetical protein ABR550_11210, partial [Wenzhouxiangellaceae bacterium]
MNRQFISPPRVDDLGFVQGRGEQAQIAPLPGVLITLEEQPEYALMARLFQMQLFEHGNRIARPALSDQHSSSGKTGCKMTTTEARIGQLQP